MRILHLADHMGYAGRIPHGMTTYLLLVLPRVRAAGHEVTCAFLRDPHKSANLLEQQGVRTHFFDTRRWDPLIPAKVATLLRTFQPDIIHATQMQAVLVARLLKAAGARANLVLHMHNLDSMPAALVWLNARLPQPHTALCVSRPVMACATTQYGINPQRLRLFPNAFDSDPFLAQLDRTTPDLRDELALPAGARLIGRVARFHPDKANDRLVRAMPRILASVPEAIAVFAGDGPDRAACEALAREVGVANQVRFIGHRNDVARIVAACDVLTITSPAEPFGFVALEAFAMGKPVVGFEAGGLPEVVTNGVDGLLAPRDDEQSFADLVSQVLLDTALRARLSAGALQSIKRFSVSRHVEELLSVYQATSGH